MPKRTKPDAAPTAPPPPEPHAAKVAIASAHVKCSTCGNPVESGKACKVDGQVTR